MPQVDMPQADFERVHFEDLVESFRRSVELVGGHVVEFAEVGDINTLLATPQLATGCVVSNIEGVTADINPDMAVDSHELGGRYTAVVRAHLGVAENGAVWVPQQMRHKAPLFAAEQLVVLLDRTALVATMQDAVADERFGGDFVHGCFVSGPSKTADIEQALVIGAHGAMGLTVVLV